MVIGIIRLHFNKDALHTAQMPFSSNTILTCKGHLPADCGWSSVLSLRLIDASIHRDIIRSVLKTNAPKISGFTPPACSVIVYLHIKYLWIILKFITWLQKNTQNFLTGCLV